MVWYTRNSVNRSISSYCRPLNKGMVGLLIDNYWHEPLVFRGVLPYWNRSVMPLLKLEIILKERLRSPF